MADGLDQVLQTAQLSSHFSSRTRARGPWAMTMPAFGDSLSFHLVLAGGLTVSVDDEDVRAEAGDLVLVPHGRGHRLGSAPGVPSRGRVDLLPQRLVSPTFSVIDLSGEGEETHLLCGVVDIRGPAAQTLLRTLPAALHVDGRSPLTTAALRPALDLLALELEGSRAGSAAVVTRLADVVVLLALRWWLEHGEGRWDGWVRALSDPQVGAALRAVHDDPAASWTVASLARVARMSRSGFAARFAELTGQTPLGYVTRWRMQVAAQTLADDPRVTVASVAASVGYGSEAAFSRAFSRVVGRSPGAARRAAGTG